MANALIFAARDGDVAEVRWRLEAEASLATYADSHGQTALMVRAFGVGWYGCVGG